MFTFPLTSLTTITVFPFSLPPPSLWAFSHSTLTVLHTEPCLPLPPANPANSAKMVHLATILLVKFESLPLPLWAQMASMSPTVASVLLPQCCWEGLPLCCGTLAAPR